ncbi:MAG: T9SS type A sorting domain-containing protein, partial [Bacteroidales bacterium]|nr:T9SS type A sorting domain-containing protein [Bacteroidales bacterium]
PGDQPTIQEGINAASNEDTVLVANGTWFENITYKGKAITVASNYILSGDTNDIHNTIIDGSNPVYPDTASVVRFVNGEDTTSVIYGFTITGGRGTNLQPAINYQAGGGILCWNSGAKIISNYIVYDSLLTDIQGIGCGIYGGPNGSNSYLLIVNNKIQNNYIYSTSPDYFATGAGIGTDCHCIIRGNNISYNTSIAENWRASAPINCRGFNNYIRFNSISENIINHNITISRADSEPQIFGGAIYIMNNYGNISNNEIKYNEVAAESSDGKCTGSGITLLYTDESFIVNNNIISYNKFTAGQLCWGGGLLILFSTPKVFNNIISNNEATNGGGIGVQGSGPEYPFIVNNTIVDNIGSWGGGMWIYEDSTIILNNIIYNNIALVNPAIYDAFETTKVNYSDIEGGWITGDGNIDVDPNFIDELYHLDCYSSQCINAGTDEIKINGITYIAPLFDFDGEPRPQDGYFDIGADEEELCTSIAELDLTETVFDLGVNPNPSSGIVIITYKQVERGKVTLNVINHKGELLKTYSLENQNPGKHTMNLDLSHLPNGLYLIRMQSGNSVETAKIILHK